MKKQLFLLLLLMPLLGFCQWNQVDSDIDGVDANESSGYTVSLSSDGSIVAIGARNNDNYTGTTRIYTNSGGTWTQVGSDIDGVDFNENSSTSVSLSSDGNTVAIGANRHDSQKGTTRIYTNSGGTWTQIGSDIDGVDTSESSGTSVSLNSDGSIVAIGADFHDSSKGTTRIYTNSGGTWTQIGSDIDGVDANERSGYSVNLSSDGNTVAIGAAFHDSKKGTTRIYTNSGGTWTQIGSDIDGVDANERSGYSVNLSSDGSNVAIGAYGHDSGKGTTRIYTNSGGTWTQIGSDIDGVDANEYSGYSVSLSSDGSIVAIGARDHDNYTGTTRIYTNSGGTWTQVAADIDGLDFNERSGISVSLSSNGSIVAIGAHYNDSGKGTTRVFKNATLSIKNNTFGSDFKIYPNPSFGVSKIQLGKNYNEVSVNVFNILGKQVAKQTHNNTNVIELNTQQFTTGIYIVKVQSGAKEATIKLVVK